MPPQCHGWLAVLLLVSATLAIGCNSADRSPLTGGGGDYLSPEELMDPESCRSCHPGQVEEWSGSMHAYAAEDPVFLALNALGQEETDGALGDFCVNCHAPLAVRAGLTDDGLNLDDVPEIYKGVTCYFCHNVSSVEGSHNNPLKLFGNSTLVGPFQDAKANPAHGSEYSRHVDGSHLASARMCGACHDIQTQGHFAPSEVKLEKTFAEWQETIYNAPLERGGATCSTCHMPASSARDRASEVSDSPSRRSSRHDFEAIDLALTPFPGRERQKALTRRMLDSSLLAEICVTQLNQIQVNLENNAGHSFPSGAALDRRIWLDVRGYSAAGKRIFSSGQVDAETPSLQQPDDAELTVLRDVFIDEQGEEAHLFWTAADQGDSTQIPGVRSLSPLDIDDFHVEVGRYFFGMKSRITEKLDRVELRVKVRPLALELVDKLVMQGRLDENIRSQLPTFTIAPSRCIPESETTAAPDVVRGTHCAADHNSEDDVTLVWTSEQILAGGLDTGKSVVDGIVADCVGQPGLYH